MTVVEAVAVGAAVVYAVGALFALGAAIGGQPALDGLGWCFAVLVALLWPIAVAWVGVRQLL